MTGVPARPGPPGRVPRRRAEDQPGARPAFDPVDSALLDTLLLEAPVAFAFYDQQLRYRRINHLLAAINGFSIDEHVGRTPSEVLDRRLGAAIEGMLRRVLETGQSIVDPDFRSTDPAGRVRYWQSQWFPSRSQGRLTGVAVLVIDVTERRANEDAVRRANESTARLQEATALLAAALTADEVGAVVSEIGRSRIGARWAGIGLLDAGGTSFQVRGTEPTGISGLAPGATDVPLDWRSPVADCIREGRVVEVVGPRAFAAQYEGEVVLEAVLSSPERSWVAVPVLLGGSPIGALRFSFDEERALDADARVFLAALAGQCSIALERARLYERERRTARALVQALVPDQLPTVPGLELAVRYLPGGDDPGDGAEIGGDWYDVFTLPSGRTALVVGDVMGKGTVAAAGMGRIRSALRALALVDESPQRVLTGLDRLVAATEDAEQIITLVYVVIDAENGYALASDAGHPPIALVRGDGSSALLRLGTSTPLGLPDVRVEVRRDLAPGDTFLAYSDGLVETRDQGIDVGMAMLLQEAARDGSRGLPQVLDDVVARLLSGQEKRDDVTVLGLRVGAGEPAQA